MRINEFVNIMNYFVDNYVKTFVFDGLLTKKNNIDVNEIVHKINKFVHIYVKISNIRNKQFTAEPFVVAWEECSIDG